MKIAKTISQIRKIIIAHKKKRETVGFVPTMGSLHRGHLSLIRRARKECGYVVVSIFLNPTQFDRQQDFHAYPRCISKDIALLKKEGVDLLFYPSVSEMYKRNFSVWVEEKELSNSLCGLYRPGHFRGVCTVVAKLFNIVQPDIAYFGRKDYQQAEIIKRLVRDLNFPVRIKVLPTIREKDGLAMSSRNLNLNPVQRLEAAAIYQALKLAREKIKRGVRNPEEVIKEMRQFLNSKKTLKIQYIKIVHPQTLEEMKNIQHSCLIACAIYCGKVRLIDSIIVKI